MERLTLVTHLVFLTPDFARSTSLSPPDSAGFDSASDLQFALDDPAIRPGARAMTSHANGGVVFCGGAEAAGPGFAQDGTE